jgi:hypothetical protein
LGGLRKANGNEKRSKKENHELTHRDEGLFNHLSVKQLIY